MSRSVMTVKYPAFGRALRALIEPTGLKLGAFAAHCGVDSATLSYWLNGRRLPSPETWPLLEDALAAAGLEWRPLHQALAREWSPRLREEAARAAADEEGLPV